MWFDASIINDNCLSSSGRRDIVLHIFPPELLGDFLDLLADRIQLLLLGVDGRLKGSYFCLSCGYLRYQWFQGRLGPEKDQHMVEDDHLRHHLILLALHLLQVLL